MKLLVIVLLLGNEVFRPVRELGRLYHDGLNGISAAQGIFSLLADQPEVVDVGARTNGSTPHPAAGQRSLKNQTSAPRLRLAVHRHSANAAAITSPLTSRLSCR